MSTSIKIAIISDLHCTSKKDTATITRLHGELLPKPISRNPIESIKERIIFEKLIADYLLCLGDVADKSDPSGLSNGIGYLNEIQLQLNAKELFLVAGNHDIDVANADPFHMLKSLDLPAIDPDSKSSYWNDHFCIIEKDDIVLFLINTCFHIRTTDDLASSPPFNNDIILDDINSRLNNYQNINKFKLVLCHHHPVQQSDFNDKYTSNDLIDGADRLLNIVKDNGFHLVLHGHKHIARIKYDDDLPIFCSGSFSSLENINPFDNKNTFHIIELKLDNHLCKGKITTWVYNYNSGWNKCEDPNFSFPAYTGFGCSYRNVKQICDEIIDKFNNWYKNEEPNKILPFNEVVNFFPDIEHITPRQQDELMRYFRDTYGLEVCPNIKNGATHIIKLKL
ncbi:MAG: metallophosphoesterase [Dysgonamonadaceae bacterium]|jgi:predicted phosphodiesterase|nr:metallophosphoesterase [Dysgonamonadaceae bacterium]